MKAVQITTQTNGSTTPLPLPSQYRKGDVPAEHYQAQIRGDVPIVKRPLSPSRFIRTAALTDGDFSGLAGDTGSLLTFITSGELTLTSSDGQKTHLEPGDLFLVDEQYASRIGVNAHNNCRLVQIDVVPEWPGSGAKVQVPGTQNPRGGIKIKRMYTGPDNRSYYREFPEFFSAPPNEWSASRPILGVRFLCWEDGFIDWHPEIVNNLPIFLSGEISVEVSGDRTVEAFRAGDILLAEDRLGMGHIDWCRGITHVAVVSIETEHLW